MQNKNDSSSERKVTKIQQFRHLIALIGWKVLHQYLRKAERHGGMADVKFSGRWESGRTLSVEGSRRGRGEATPALSFRLGLQLGGALDKMKVNNCV